MSDTTVVYFAQAGPGGPIKIGIAKDHVRRFDSLQTGCPVRLTLLGYVPGDKSDEGTLHRLFSPLRIHGEWFALAEPIIVWLQEHGMEPSLEGRCEMCAVTGEKNYELVRNLMWFIDEWIELRRVCEEAGLTTTNVAGPMPRCAEDVMGGYWRPMGRNGARFMDSVVLPPFEKNLQDGFEKTLTAGRKRRSFSPTVPTTSHTAVSSPSDATDQSRQTPAINRS